MEHPNIMLVVASDLGAWTLGCYGNREVRTPHLDQLAAFGARFENNFVATPASSASRATLFTGRLPQQTGIVDFLTAEPVANPPQGQSAPPPAFSSEVMVSDLLAAQGYACGYAGYWDFGGEGQAHHFSSWQGRAQRETPDAVTAQAGQFLGQQAAGKPFFLTVTYAAPHAPYTGVPQKYYDQYAGTRFDSIGWQPASPTALRHKELLKDPHDSMRKYAAAVSFLDDQVGSLYATLQQRGLSENTITIFCADTGELMARHGLWGQGLASQPINLYEEVVRVPMIWVWPGRIPPQSVRPEMISSYDLLPSLAEAAGASVPEDRHLTGRSYFPVATNQPLPKKQPWRTMIFGQYRDSEMARDTRYKLVLRDKGSGPNAFYALATDPRENVNQYENPQFVNARDHLATELGSWRQKLS